MDYYVGLELYGVQSLDRSRSNAPHSSPLVMPSPKFATCTVDLATHRPTRRGRMRCIARTSKASAWVSGWQLEIDPKLK